MIRSDGGGSMGGSNLRSLFRGITVLKTMIKVSISSF